MKTNPGRILFVISLVLLSSFINPLKATHARGGEITWQCLEQGTDMGKLVFTIKLWAACFPGAGSMPSTASISNPLYATYGGVSSITCTRISITDISPMCYDTAKAVYCGLGGGLGIMGLNEHVYVSAPVQINGVPSTTGSAFSYSSCCRPTAINTTGGGLYLRSVMYPYTDPFTNQVSSLGSTTGGPSCYDNSPIYTEKVPYIQINSKHNYYSLNSLDKDCDSLDYERSMPMVSSTSAVTWRQWFSNAWPMGQGTSNIPLTIDQKTGLAHHLTFGTNGLYQLAHKVTSYKNKQRVAEIFRDYAMVMNSGAVDSISMLNNPPWITFKNAGAASSAAFYSDTFLVGDSVHININATDLNFLSASTFQSVSLRILPNRALNSLFNPLGCIYSSCATLDTSGSHWNGSTFSNPITALADFKWKLECEHFEQCGNLDDYNKEYRTFTFSVEATDNSCSVPMKNIKDFSITIRDTLKKEAPLAGIVFADTIAHISWKVNSGSAFTSYNIYKSDSANGPYVLLDSISSLLDTTFTDSLALSGGEYKYYRVVTTEGSPCSDEGTEARSIVLHVFDSTKQYNKLSWNSQHYIGRSTIWGYNLIEADTGSGWFLLDSLRALIDTTYYVDSIYSCNTYVNYRIRGFDLSNDMHYVSNTDSVRKSFQTYNDSLSICEGDSVFLQGQYQTSSGNYLQIYQGAICDSSVMVKLTVNTVDTSVAVNKRTLKANAGNATYKWISCSADSVILATTKSFTPDSNGTYAVIVTQNGCTDTSSCYTIQAIGIDQVESDAMIRAYPNPGDGLITLTSQRSMKNKKLSVYNTEGKLLSYSILQDDFKVEVDISSQPPGLYYLKISHGNQVIYQMKYVKH